MNVYDDYEFEELDEFEKSREEKSRFEIEDLETANWALRKIAAINKLMAEKEKLAESEHERINLWLEKVIETDKRNIMFFEGLLKCYFMKEKKKDKRFKLSTPYGSVTSRKQQPIWEYSDDNVIENLEKLGLNKLVKTEVKKLLNKTEIKKVLDIANGKAVTKEGEIVEGITVIEQEDKITVKTI